MDEDHERIEELLAAYALESLAGEDAAEADGLLARHVPSCLSCRHTLADFQDLAGELALAADPVPLPDLVRARIQRGIDEVPFARRRARRGSFVALAAGVAALMTMGGLSLVTMGRANRAEDERSLAIELLTGMSLPGRDRVLVNPQGDAPTSSGFVGLPAPDVHRLYLVADGSPDPSPGYAYQLWLGSGGSFKRFGEMFVPQNGVVLIELTVDVARYDEIWITEELAGTTPDAPGVDGPSWRARLP
jgi:hypothetical protein